MTLDQLENNIRQYLLLEDKGIIKLLCATVIANRIPELDPTWVFIVSNSSGGKSELLNALSNIKGAWEQDDLTSKTLISGAKSAQTETSLIFRITQYKDPIMIFKDLTLLLDKDTKESSQIFSQLRLIYDGKLNKSFGTGEDVKAETRMGLIAGTTSAIEDTQAKQASMGQRAIRYYMKQPNRHDVTRLILKGRKEKDMRVMIANSFREFLDDTVKIPSAVPDLPDATIEDITNLAEMATAARSSIKRKEYSRDNPIERADLKEMPGRMAKQLKNIGQAMIIMNEGPLTPLDHQILYQLALDSIPSSRKVVMGLATSTRAVNYMGLSMVMKLPVESVKIHVDDLVALDILVKEKGYGRGMQGFQFRMREDYRQLMEKFEGIKLTNEIMKTEEDEELLPLTPEEQFSLQTTKLI